MKKLGNCDNHKNIYLNGHRKRRMVSESMCITEDKKNQNLEIKIDNNKFRRRNKQQQGDDK